MNIPDLDVQVLAETFRGYRKAEVLLKKTWNLKRSEIQLMLSDTDTP